MRRCCFGLMLALAAGTCAAAPTIRLIGLSGPDQSVLGLQPDDRSYASIAPGISSDGRYVVFAGNAGNLVVNDGNLGSDVFRRDLTNGQTRRMSLTSAGNEGAGSPGTDQAMTPDGRYVVFSSRAPLTAADSDSFYDVYVRDTQANLTTFASVPAVAGADGDAQSPVISDDGRYVAFWSNASNLVANDTNADYDVFVRDLQASTTTRVSVATGGAQSNGFSLIPAISGNGRYVAFTSYATNLVAGDANNEPDVFVHDLTNSTTVLGSLGNGAVAGNGGSSYPSLSTDGRYLAFESAATNLVAGDTNAAADIFLRDLVGNTTERVSVGAGGQADSDSYLASVSGDGRFVAFGSISTNLVAGDGNQSADVFVRDRVAGTTVRASVANNGAQLARQSVFAFLSRTGRFVVFGYDGADIGPGDSNGFDDVYVRDLTAGTTTRVSLADSAGPFPAEATGDSHSAAVANGGVAVAFLSDALNLLPGDSNGFSDVYVRNTSTGSLQRANLGPAGVQANEASYRALLSADGRRVTFDTGASNLVAADSNTRQDVLQRDLQAGTTLRASRFGAVEPNGDSSAPSASADGRYIAFATDATNAPGAAPFTAGDPYRHVYVHDTQAGTTVRASVSSAGVAGNAESYAPAISDDGRYVVFATAATNLAAGDASSVVKIVRRDLVAQQTVLVSVAAVSPPADANSALYPRAISADGRYVAFESDAANLVAGDSNNSPDVFVRDMVANVTTRVSVIPGGAQGDNTSQTASISADGRFVSFETSAQNLTGDPQAYSHVMLHDRVLGTLQRVSTDAFGTIGDDNSHGGMLSPDGRNLGFDSRAGNFNLDAGGQNGRRGDAYVVQLVENTGSFLTGAVAVIGTPTLLTASVAGSDSNPRGGSLTINASTGESCTTPVVQPLTPTTAGASCSISFATLGARTATASWAATPNYLASTSAQVAIDVRNQAIFANGFQ